MMPSVNKYNHGREPRGTVIHQAKRVYQDNFTKLWMQTVADGQYEPHGGNRYHMTKQEKKANRKASTWEKLDKQDEESKGWN